MPVSDSGIRASCTMAQLAFSAQPPWSSPTRRLTALSTHPVPSLCLLSDALSSLYNLLKYHFLRVPFLDPCSAPSSGFPSYLASHSVSCLSWTFCQQILIEQCFLGYLVKGWWSWKRSFMGPSFMGDTDFFKP